MLTFKRGVNVAGIAPEGIRLIAEVYRVWTDCFPRPLVVTSVTDGKHMIGSLHYKGKAADFRTRGLSRERQEVLLRVLKQELEEEFDFVLEPTHLHGEYDPK